MEFKTGDILSGKGIQYGKLCGIESINNSDFFRIEDLTKKATYFIAIEERDFLRKLASEDEVNHTLKMFNTKEHIDVGEVEGSRYKYFKTKLESVSFKNSMEVLHDMASLKLEGLLNTSEKKLYQSLKEKLSLEITYILNKNLDEVQEILEFSPSV